jgi:hypothetical protein
MKKNSYYFDHEKLDAYQAAMEFVVRINGSRSENGHASANVHGMNQVLR